MSPEQILPIDGILELLCCPNTGASLTRRGSTLLGSEGTSYRISDSGIPLFAEKFCSADGRQQREHYERIAAAYVENLGYPHTEEYTTYLDNALLAAVDRPLGTTAELCCGRGEAFSLLGSRVARGIGVDVSPSMLEQALLFSHNSGLVFLQADATMLPLRNASFDSVFMLGGIHHVRDRNQLFSEIARILKPGGRFYFREPVSDFWLWRSLRWAIYRISPTLDHETERPLLWSESVPVLEANRLRLTEWKTYGFVGFCLFMNSDVLVFNRLFRFLPGIRGLTRAATKLDSAILSLPG
ncbi:MAG TPA: class I SAM-dependent methyltransferase, partial [Bradyrhizobium sp.]|nr:class I SAM-dependent methyltransferase [Bradyrhizobium sp.]